MNLNVKLVKIVKLLIRSEILNIWTKYPKFKVSIIYIFLLVFTFLGGYAL